MRVHFPPFVLLIIALLTVTTVQMISTWKEATSYPWDNLNTDQFVLGSVYEKTTNPDSLPRDYILQNEKSYAYYTPSFMVLIKNVARLTNESYLNSLAVLQGPILILYLIAAYVLFQLLSGSSLVGILLAFLSVTNYVALKDFWGVTGLENMLPRTIALPVVVAASLTFFHVLRFPDKHQRVLWAVTGLLIGIIANLHPPTGITFALVVGAAGLFHWKRLTGNKYLNLAWLVGSAVVAGIPIILHMLQNTDSAEITDFQAFATAYMNRVSMYPFKHPVYGRIALFEPTYQLLLGFFWLPLTLISLFAMKNNARSWTAWPFILVQVVYFWFIVAQYSDVRFNAVAIIFVFYFWHWRRRDEKQELIWLYFLASMILVSYFLAVVLRACWLGFEMTALTTLVSQLPRGARQMLLPVLLIGARLSGDLLNRWEKIPSKELIWIEFLVIMALATFENPSVLHILLAVLFRQRHRLSDWRLNKSPFFAVWSGFSALAATWLILGSHLLIPVLAGAVVGAGIWLSLRGWLTTSPMVLGSITVAVVISVVLVGLFPGSLDPVKDMTKPATSSLVTVAVVVGAGLFLLFGRLENLAGKQLSAYILVPLLIVAGLQLLEAAGVTDLSDDNQTEPNSEYLVGRWARHNTPPDALFFCQDLDGSAFRFWAQRSIVMSHKDLGVFVALARPAELVAWTARWDRLDQLRGDDIVSDPEAAQADYIIIPQDAERLSLPVVYSDHYAIVYQNNTAPLNE